MSDSRAQGLYPKSTMANLLNISERRIEQLVKEKVIPKAGRGVFDLGPTVNAYVRYLQGLSAGNLRAKDQSDMDRRLMEARVLERESKARQAKYRADAMEQSLSDSTLWRSLLRIPDELSSRLAVPEEILLELRKLVAELARC